MTDASPTFTIRAILRYITPCFSRGGHPYFFVPRFLPTCEKQDILFTHFSGIAFLKKLIEARKLKPVIDKVYRLDQIAEAHAYRRERSQKRKRGNSDLS
jgi:hypothetical protein